MKRLHIIDSLLLMTLAFLCYEKLTNTVCMCSRGASFRSPQLQFLHIDELLWPKKFHYLLHYTILKYLNDVLFCIIHCSTQVLLSNQRTRLDKGSMKYKGNHRNLSASTHSISPTLITEHLEILLMLHTSHLAIMCFSKVNLFGV